MTGELQKSLIRPLISRRDISESLAGRSSGDLGVDNLLVDVQCRGRLVRAMPKSLQTLLVFSGSNGLLLVPYHPDSRRGVDCVLAPRELALATWLGTVPAPPLTMPQRISAEPPVEDEVDPRSVLLDAVLGETGIRETLSIEVHRHGNPGWQALCVTGRSTRWGFGQLNERIRLQRRGLLGLWALLGQIAVPEPGELLREATLYESLGSSDRIQNLVGGPR